MLAVKGHKHFLLTQTDIDVFSDKLVRICLADAEPYVIKLNQLFYISPSAILFDIN